jgi:Collagen triple helix repeat (20 copies)
VTYQTSIEQIDPIGAALLVVRKTLPALLQRELEKVVIPTPPNAVSIDSAAVNRDGNLIISLTDGRVVVAGKVRGESAVGLRGPRGQRGPRGHGITAVTANDNILRLAFTDGDVQELAIPRLHGERGLTGTKGDRGEPGDQGDPGNGIAAAWLDDAFHLWFRLDDGTHIDAGALPQGPRGPRGDKGDQGDPGLDGTGIASLWIDTDFHLWFRLDDGLQIDAGGLPAGARGPKGDKGDQGEDGKDGVDGCDGTDGEKGLRGRTGPQGRPGEDGQPGVDGRDGKDGAPGLPGAKGDRGDDGDQGPPGNDGQDGRGIAQILIQGTELIVRYTDASEESAGILPIRDNSIDLEILIDEVAGIVSNKVRDEWLQQRDQHARSLLKISRKLDETALLWS